MKSFSPRGKYQAFKKISLENRAWPDKSITAAPAWCSVDLRDGNQALVNPMSYKKKIELYQCLVDIGFTEIEIGFPSASDTEYEFTRGLIENQLVTNNIWPQVLVQARENLIERTFQAIDGSPRAIVHIYNSTSEVQRRVVFQKDRRGIIEIATSAVQYIKELTAKCKSEIRLEYSPESFTGTELDFALEICTAVSEIWGPTPQNKLILNLPATVELATPNVYADQIEWFIKNLPNRESHIISVHTHNDRGTGVAATELAMLAGAERVEGTLFGNGERTGNLDIVTAALNLYTSGIDPNLDLRNINKIREIYSRTTGMDVHERHPYAGELVFTAFSGSHQDAIKKGMDARKNDQSSIWEVPYLPIDPSDLGRSYEAIIRINSQSGKGGVAYIMQNEFGIELPKAMHPDFGLVVQKLSDSLGTELANSLIFEKFQSEYLEQSVGYKFISFKSVPVNEDSSEVEIHLTLEKDSKRFEIVASGNGPIDGTVKGLIKDLNIHFDISHYSEQALSFGSEAKAIAFIELTKESNSKFGVGIDSNTTKASIKALISALNRFKAC